MARPKESIFNKQTIGTSDNPVNKIWVNEIHGLVNMAKDAQTYSTGPDAQAYTGQSFNPSTGKIEYESEIASNITHVGDWYQTGDHVITGNIGVTGPINRTAVAGKGMIIGALGNANFYQKVIAAGIIEANANIQIGANFISNDGDNEGISIDASGNVTISGLAGANALTTTNAIVSSTAHIEAKTNFRCNGNVGQTTTIDFSTYNGTITLNGGIITSVP